MSDLISTPSQAQSPVSSEAFETLIDLLASDGIDGTPSNLAGDHARPQPDLSLRDPSGKLDFDKIRLMFAAQNKIAQEKNRVQPLTVCHNDSESDGDHQSMSSVVPSCPRSVSPTPVERPSAAHRRSSTFGNQPWAAIHENAAKEDVAPTPSRQSLSFDDVNAALVSAREEVRSLRQEYDTLHALVSKQFGAEVRVLNGVNGEQVASVQQKGHAETLAAGSEAQPGAIIPLAPPSRPLNVPAEIADLTEEQAKRALGALARSLNLSLDAITSMASHLSTSSPAPESMPPNPMRQHDIASITRALKFFGTVDELVWRRTSTPSGPRTLLPVFSEENIVALVARLELWERAVRRSTRS